MSVVYWVWPGRGWRRAGLQLKDGSRIPRHSSWQPVSCVGTAARFAPAPSSAPPASLYTRSRFTTCAPASVQQGAHTSEEGVFAQAAISLCAASPRVRLQVCNTKCRHAAFD
eukprot:1138181-Pelagomonas_calceolata.AAC.2